MTHHADWGSFVALGLSPVAIAASSIPYLAKIVFQVSVSGTIL